MRFTLIVPVAPERGAEIIESIKKLDYPREMFHVVVVRGKNPSENRNKGSARAKGEILAFLDDDASLPENYLKEAEKFFIRYPDIDIVGGPQLTPLDDKGFARISGYALSSTFGAWKIANRYSERKTVLDADETAVTSANLLCRREVMEKVQFDTNLFPGEDPKFITDAKKEGFNVAYTPDIKLYHRRRNTIKALLKQIYNYGKVRPLKESFIETLKMPYFLIPSAFLIYLLALLGIIVFNPTLTGQAIGIGNNTILKTMSFSKVLFLPLIAYIILCLSFGTHDAIHNKDYKAMFVLPFIYPLIHLSYGSGMLRGYLKKLFY